VPFPHFVTAVLAIVKRFPLFGVEVRRTAAFMASALNAQPLPPHGQISPFSETPPKPSGFAIAARQTPFAGCLTRFNQPSELFAA
jgi:hypothetical protein